MHAGENILEKVRSIQRPLSEDGDIDGAEDVRACMQCNAKHPHTHCNLSSALPWTCSGRTLRPDGTSR